MEKQISSEILQEMQDYYRARAGEYNQWFYRQGRFDLGEQGNAHWNAEVADLFKHLKHQNLTGDVLELAPGTGIWTEQLLKTATTVTAVDASQEMLAINHARLGSERVSYVQADLFQWQPNRTYDAVCFCFWISHVPLDRLDSFLSMVASALKPGGKVFFVDSQPKPNDTTSDQPLLDKDQQVITRILNDGRTFQIIKNFYDPQDLTSRFSRAHLQMTVQEKPNFFIYGSGKRV